MDGGSAEVVLQFIVRHRCLSKGVDLQSPELTILWGSVDKDDAICGLIKSIFCHQCIFPLCFI